MALSNGTGSVSGNAQNIPEAHTPRNYSSFDLNAHRFNTERFGEYTPIIAFESVKEDKLPVRLAHNLMSYTMSAPLMQDLTKYKELFAVPMEAILPENWEKFFDNPVRGDDVSSDVGPAIEDFWSKVVSSMNSLRSAVVTNLASTPADPELALQSLLRFLIIGEYFFSNGSLMATLGCHGAPYVDIVSISTGEHLSWDSLFDKFITYISQYVESFSLQDMTNNSTYSVHFGDYDDSRGRVPFRHALCLLRDDLTCWVDSVSLVSGQTASAFASFFSNLFNTEYIFYFNAAQIPFNTQFLSAYQLCCAHYFSNDHVDFIYSAELYRQLIGHYLSYHTSYSHYFTRNGIKYRYDYLSAHAISFFVNWTAISSSLSQYLLSVTNGTGSAHDGPRSVIGFLSAFFGFRRSLKYLDYFTGARTTPLAVGTTGVPVSGSTVSVIDITRNIQRQRFFNSINRIAHSFEGYLKGLFGGDMPAPDYHNPFQLARTSDSVFGDQTNNTASEQMNDDIAITTNLRANSNNYMFEVQSDRPCVIIAITYYDIPRIHLTSMDRSFLHLDRFDYFNPFMQYTGDQPVYLQELGTQSLLSTTLQNFAYQLKFGEYKQLYNSCAGGFVEHLPGFMFRAVDRRGTNFYLTPDFIRSVCSEFDYFYNSLTGYSNGSYFHFIVDNYVDFSGTRPMAFAPQILG